MRVVIITSCTGEKVIHHERALTVEDFQQGATHIAAREEELVSLLTPAEELYSGQQHVRLMRGVRVFRQQSLTNLKKPCVALWILSAGYGLIPSTQQVAPYECTFQGMKAKGRCFRPVDCISD